MDIQHIHFARRRCDVGWVVLVAYLVAGTGVLPSPARLAHWLGGVSPGQAERYPCEACGCGCASAAECWSRCCCHTEHERLVWAIRHGVMPPAELEFSDEAWRAAANAADPRREHCGLCVESVRERLRFGVPLGEVERRGDEARSKRSPGLSVSALGCKHRSAYMLVMMLPSWPGGASEIMFVPTLSWRMTAPEQPVPASCELEVPQPPPRAAA